MRSVKNTLFAALLFAACAFAPAQVAPAQDAVYSVQKELTALKDRCGGYFSIGTAVNPTNITGTSGELVAKHFNSIVAENVMKPLYIQPTEGKFFWDDADAVVKFAKENGMELRYHTLLWHEQVPNWFFLDASGKEMIYELDPAKREANKKLLLKRVETHVKTVVARYRKDIRSWDVVNEVIDASGPEGMRYSKWYQIAGKDYIETAFRAARKAGGKNIKLFINDYGTDDPAKRDILYKFVKELLKKRVPIDGVGHQTHIGPDSPSAARIGDSIRLFASLGLDNQITELDVSVYSDSAAAYDEVPRDLLVRQGYRYKELFEELFRLKDAISNVTLWGIADTGSWLNNRPIPRADAPLLFDGNLQAKPAYWGIVDPSRLPPKPSALSPRAQPKLGEAAYGTPVVDGSIEAAWALAKQMDLNVTAAGKPTVSAKARTLWDDTFLYILIEVTDPVLDNTAKNEYEKDSIEFYLDENNAKASNYDADDGQYRVTFDNAQSFGSNGKVKGFASASRITEGGYVVEAAVPFRTVAPAANLIVGFDAQVNDADGNAVRQGIIKWNDASDNSYRDTLNWGTLKLLP